MSYTKNIAVIKGLRDGFSADGGTLSGLIKAEKYSGRLIIEVNLINFAPLTEGRYVVAVSDGTHSEIIENCAFEGQSEVDTSAGFSAVICYVNTAVQVIATAVCGNFQAAAFGLKSEIERAEKIRPVSAEKPVAGTSNIPVAAEDSAAKRANEVEKTDSIQEKTRPVATIPPEIYEDEAISEVNYYEFPQTDESGGAVCENAQKEENGTELFEDAAHTCAVEEGGTGLARGGFFERMKAEIEGLISAYPACAELERAVEGSKWVQISYGDGKFYVFGVIYADCAPRYICYGLPSFNSSEPPESMRALSSFLPVETALGVGFWVMYQDAETGASVQISNI